MTEINDNTKPPVSYEIAQRFIADFNLCHHYWENYSDDIMNGSKTPAHSQVLGQMMQTLLQSSDAILDRLYESYPAEFLGYCSDNPQRKMTENEVNLAEHYIKTYGT